MSARRLEPPADLFHVEVDGFKDADKKMPFADTWPLPPGITAETRGKQPIKGFWVPTTARCVHPYIDNYGYGGYWYKWCLAPLSPNTEAKRETYRYRPGHPLQYLFSGDYDCQVEGDLVEMLTRPTVYLAACLP
jgi:hypothetical protein